MINQDDDFLLNVYKCGEREKSQFNEQCFEKPIKSNKIFNFASEALQKMQKIGVITIQLKMERYIKGRLLSNSSEHRIDVNMTFPFGPVPTSLAQYN